MQLVDTHCISQLEAEELFNPLQTLNLRSYLNSGQHTLDMNKILDDADLVYVY